MMPTLLVQILIVKNIFYSMCKLYSYINSNCAQSHKLQHSQHLIDEAHKVLNLRNSWVRSQVASCLQTFGFSELIVLDVINHVFFLEIVGVTKCSAVFSLSLQGSLLHQKTYTLQDSSAAGAVSPLIMIRLEKSKNAT